MENTRIHYKTCEICGIRSGRLDGQKRIFMAKFPLDENRCKQWVKNTGKEDLVYIPIEKLHQLKHICGSHFLAKAFKKRKTQLRKNAIPSERLSAEPLADELLIGFPLHIAKIDRPELTSVVTKEHGYCASWTITPTPLTSTAEPVVEISRKRKMILTTAPSTLSAGLVTKRPKKTSEAFEESCKSPDSMIEIIKKRKICSGTEPIITTARTLRKGKLTTSKTSTITPRKRNLNICANKHIKSEMDKLKKGWFTESCEMWQGGTFSFQVKEVLHHEKSQYQDIQVFDSVSFGRVLVLDGIIQCTQKDEFSYQEMISFLPLCCHKNPERVLIVGGGDGGVAREVAKHPKVKKIVQVEIDDRVIEVSKKYLPFMAVGFNSDKLTLHVGDGFEFMKNHSQEFDVIITDSSDPVGPAVSLFQENYFALMKSALRPNGIVCSQAGTFWNDIELVTSVLTCCRNQFPAATYAYTSVPTYPSGTIGFVIGSLDKNVKFEEPTIKFTPKEEKAMNLRFYNTNLHRAAFALPTFIRNQLG